MCGIAGLVDPAGPTPALRGVLDRLAHRGPDDHGMWLDETGTLALGHRRLSIIDLSPAGHQPMTSASGRYVITYNGEIYNHAELRRGLELEGVSPAWRGHSDTETLIAGFDAFGIEETLRRANGMFALAVYDKVRRELTLARDRMGEKPLYFGWLGGRFAFASELSALRSVPGWAPRMDSSAVASFLLAGYVRGPQSAVQGIYRLPPATLIRFAIEDLAQPRDWSWLSARLQPYWSLRDAALGGIAQPLDVDAQRAADGLESLLRDAVRMRMMSDVPLGAFLSGGIDSSLIAALMLSESSQPVRTYCIGFEEREFDEAPHARAVARHLGTEHTELYAGPSDALALVPRLAETLDEPFADQSQIPTLLLSSLARRHVTVALSGDGGDELFAGYGRYFAIVRLWQGLQQMPDLARRSAAPLLGAMGRTLRPIASIAGPHQTIPHRLERLSERLAAPDLDALRLSFISGGAAPKLLRNRHVQDLAYCLPPATMHDALTRLMFADQLDYLPDDILHKVDRASMAFGLETRVPLLDHRVVEFSWRLPSSLRATQHHGKLLLRQVLDRHVPASLLNRPKQGFSPPISIWLRGPLRDWAESLLSESALRDLPMLNSNNVRALWDAHGKQRMDAGQALWNVLMLADWRRRFSASA